MRATFCLVPPKKWMGGMGECRGRGGGGAHKRASLLFSGKFDVCNVKFRPKDY